jgi:hypothetical protein
MMNSTNGGLNSGGGGGGNRFDHVEPCLERSKLRVGGGVASGPSTAKTS